MSGLDTVTIIGIVVTVITVAGGAIWWASAMQAKLDMLIQFHSGAKAASDALAARLMLVEKDLIELKARK